MSEPYLNSIGQTMAPISPGEFTMGSDRGDWDERPAHSVTLSRPYWLAVTPVTNAQFEMFDPTHAVRRGEQGLSRADDDAVIFVDWYQANEFCAWLTQREGRLYRLPSEAEWEFACRAGSKTPYSTGPALPTACWREQEFDWYPRPVDLRVGTTPANAWGLQDMHGLVEEWCADAYAPYNGEASEDPFVDRGLLRVSRGGSHNTTPEHLRSANRAAALPDDAHWLLGFRVACGEPLLPSPRAACSPPLWAQNVGAAPAQWAEPSVVPQWQTPRRYVEIAPEADGPLYAQHNHCPALTWCPNGDLLAVWFSCRTERGREMVIAGARLRWGASKWDDADLFFDVADRNLTGSALWHDGNGRLLHLNGMEAGHGWAQLALVLRESLDGGVTWTTTLADANRRPGNQVIANIVRSSSGRLLLCCDAVWSGNGGTVLHASDDQGRSWQRLSAEAAPPHFAAGARGDWIAGIHGAVAELADGSLLAYGRGDSIDGRLTESRSTDGGRTWTYAASAWPPLGGGQRLVLLRLADGPLLLCSFTDPSGLREPAGLPTIDAAGHERRVFGLFAALSYDDGQTWPVLKLLTPGAGSAPLNGGAWTGEFTPDADHAEPRGYLAATQTPDGLIHLVSSALYYRFNVAWLEQPMPAA